MNRRNFLKTIGLGTAALAIPGCLIKAKETKPNFVFFLIDDLGWTDVGCFGSTFYETPNIDRLANEGMRFTDAYAACPVCSPTRASILTGKYPARLNITDWIPGLDPKNQKLLGSKDNHQLPLEEKTIAEVLKDAGYATGFFGKWHLGDKGFYPERQGFDVNKGGHWAGAPASYFYPYKNKRKRWDVPGLNDGEDGEYLTGRLTDESIQFIDSNKNKQFLLYLSHYAVHTPIQSKPELTEKYKQKKEKMPEINEPDYIQERESQSKQKQDNAAYAGMVQSVDESVDRILDKLDELKLSDNTVVIFMSDNGGLSTLPGNRKSPTSVVPLRAGKGWLYEGGIREPMIIKWPGIVKPGSECNVPVTSTDFYPTMLEMANLPPMPEQHADGLSLFPLLKQQKELSREAIYWHYPHYHGSGNKPSAAIRAGDYKLIEWFEDSSIELYNLKEDISENNNLAEKMPQKALELKNKLHDWQTEVGALKPNLNPDWGEDN
ncbi:sulfatase-like hydrolase/transferase [candidate division KSB1 bacterium]|nr:sulfatase-like hydrolase/transferase [candidate division KSB1 bacterium]